MTWVTDKGVRLSIVPNGTGFKELNYFTKEENDWHFQPVNPTLLKPVADYLDTLDFHKVKTKYTDDILSFEIYLFRESCDN